MPDVPGVKVSQATVSIRLEPVSITVSDSGEADIMYARTITDTTTQDVIVRDSIRVAEDLAERFQDVTSSISYFINKNKAT